MSTRKRKEKGNLTGGLIKTEYDRDVGRVQYSALWNCGAAPRKLDGLDRLACGYRIQVVAPAGGSAGTALLMWFAQRG